MLPGPGIGAMCGIIGGAIGKEDCKDEGAMLVGGVPAAARIAAVAAAALGALLAERPDGGIRGIEPGGRTGCPIAGVGTAALPCPLKAEAPKALAVADPALAF